MKFKVLFIFSVYLFCDLSLANKVRECRNECLERNNYKIVRVHLRENNVYVGLCRNISQDAIVFPFNCIQNLGIWNLTKNDAEYRPIAMKIFSGINCPSVKIVLKDQLSTCPAQDKNGIELLNKHESELRVDIIDIIMKEFVIIVIE